MDKLKIITRACVVYKVDGRLVWRHLRTGKYEKATWFNIDNWKTRRNKYGYYWS